MKNNVEGTIDDLLEDVDQALLAGYAQKHGRSLKWANAAYKMVCRDRDVLSRKVVVLFWSWVTGLVFIVAYATVVGILNSFGFATLMIGFSALMVIWQVLVLRLWKENAGAAAEYQCILADFRKAVEALNLEKYPDLHLPYSVHSVRVVLLRAADKLLEAEAEFTACRYDRQSSEGDLFLANQKKSDCYWVLEDRVQAAAKFGLTSENEMCILLEVTGVSYRQD